MHRLDPRSSVTTSRPQGEAAQGPNTGNGTEAYIKQRRLMTWVISVEEGADE
uniref:Uncharacterized protein n=1 Tax=Arundo donax TaxID=35708 RepID=A0A0A9CC14_ARUDO